MERMAEESKRESRTVQIQAVLYHNQPEQLNRAIQTLDAAAATAGEQGWTVQLRWGDASESPVYSKAEWNAMEKACPHLQRMAYSIFNRNTGYGAGNNLLAHESAADYLLIMNPEILLPPTALLDLLAPFADPWIGMTEARQIPVEHPKEYDPETMETEWCSGACFVIPTDLFRRLGGLMKIPSLCTAKTWIYPGACGWKGTGCITSLGRGYFTQGAFHRRGIISPAQQSRCTRFFPRQCWRINGDIRITPETGCVWRRKGATPEAKWR